MSSIGGKWMKIRLYSICAIFVVVFAAVMYKAFDLQVTRRDQLVAKAQQETIRYLKLGAVRGEIFDATGERLAASLPSPTLAADPSIINNHDEVATLLSEILDIPQDVLLNKLSEKTKYIELKHRLTDQEIQAVEALNIRGMIFRKEYLRTYPNGTMASHFLGFVGRDGQGLEGMERSLDNYLKAGPEKLRVKRDNLGRIMVDDFDVDIDQSKGASVVLTIDRRIQYIAEKALAASVEKYHAKSGMALVMRPKTGAIVASAVWPTFDPNNFNTYPDEVKRNRILTDPFEPGSTFKVFVVAAALEEGLVNPEYVINCENGSYRVANHTVRDTHNYDDLTVSQIIKYSSNIGSLKIGAILGNNLLHNYLTRFSFGERTGLEHLSGEAAGSLRSPKGWREVEAANIAFGQGLSVTALQMVMAMSALANDGVMMKPYMVDRVLDAEGRTIEQYEPQILRQVVSPLTARQVAAMLRMAVQKGGTATRAEVTGYPVAGKTGTAQKVSRGSKTYSAGKYVASFLGFAPYHDPQLCLMVVLDEPQNGYYGGTVATPAFKEIMEQALPLLDIPPTEDKGDPVWPLLTRDGGGAPGVVAANQPINYLWVRLKKGDRGAKGPITVNSDTHGVILRNMDPSSGQAFADVVTGPAAYPGIMPDLAGLSMRQVMEIMSDYQMDIEYMGSGLVVGQNPSPGAAVDEGQPGAIIFERQ